MSPRILLLCATERGRIFAEKLISLVPDADVTVCTFPEEPWEPPFAVAIEKMSQTHNKRFFLCRNVDRPEIFADGDFDLLFAVSWRYLVPPAVAKRLRLGAFVFHDSLLPKYRGFSPTVWSLVNGESETGVTLFEMAASVDSGAIVDQQQIPIASDEYIGSVLQRVTETYLVMLERNLPLLLAAASKKHVQDESQATYVCKRTPADNLIDWRGPALTVFNLIRAVSKPYTGAFTHLNDRKLFVWSADLPTDSRQYVGIIPGRVLDRLPGVGATVLAGDRAIFLRDVQVEGGMITTADQILTNTGMRLY